MYEKTAIPCLFTCCKAKQNPESNRHGMLRMLDMKTKGSSIVSFLYLIAWLQFPADLAFWFNLSCALFAALVPLKHVKRGLLSSPPRYLFAPRHRDSGYRSLEYILDGNVGPVKCE